MYAVDARYPGAEVEEEEVGPALDLAAEVLAMVRQLIAEDASSTP